MRPYDEAKAEWWGEFGQAYRALTNTSVHNTGAWLEFLDAYREALTQCAENPACAPDLTVGLVHYLAARKVTNKLIDGNPHYAFLPVLEN